MGRLFYIVTKLLRGVLHTVTALQAQIYHKI